MCMHAFASYVCRETDEDPGIIRYFADDANIHSCLGLASLATVNATNYGYTISPPNQGTKQIVISLVIHVTGLNPAQSRINFQNWLDNIIAAMSSKNPLVLGPNNTREPGLYHHLLGHEFDQITSLLTQATLQWGNDCQINNFTCGHLYYIRPGGPGSLTVTCQVWGPFL